MRRGAGAQTRLPVPGRCRCPPTTPICESASTTNPRSDPSGTRSGAHRIRNERWGAKQAAAAPGGRGTVVIWANKLICTAHWHALRRVRTMRGVAEARRRGPSGTLWIGGCVLEAWIGSYVVISPDVEAKERTSNNIYRWLI